MWLVRYNRLVYHSTVWSVRYRRLVYHSTVWLVRYRRLVYHSTVWSVRLRRPEVWWHIFSPVSPFTSGCQHLSDSVVWRHSDSVIGMINYWKYNSWYLFKISNILFLSDQKLNIIVIILIIDLILNILNHCKYRQIWKENQSEIQGEGSQYLNHAHHWDINYIDYNNHINNITLLLIGSIL